MADDILLKISGITGESKVDGHKGEIDVMGVSFGVNNTGSMSQGGGGGSGRVSFHDVHMTKPIDESSNALALACCEGKHIPEAKFTFRKQGSGQKDYLVVTLTDVLVSSWTFGHHDHPETLSLNFSKIKYEYKAQDEKGSLGGAKTFGWDLKAVKKF